MIIPRYYEDLSVLHENTEKPRAYYTQLQSVWIILSKSEKSLTAYKA